MTALWWIVRKKFWILKVLSIFLKWIRNFFYSRKQKIQIKTFKITKSLKPPPSPPPLTHIACTNSYLTVHVLFIILMPIDISDRKPERQKKPSTLYQLRQNLCLYYRRSFASSELRTVIKTLIEFISYSILILHPYFSSQTILTTIERWKNLEIQLASPRSISSSLLDVT